MMNDSSLTVRIDLDEDYCMISWLGHVRIWHCESLSDFVDVEMLVPGLIARCSSVGSSELSS